MVSAADGSFRVSPLLPGSYSLKAAASGFRTLVEDATVQVGQVTTVDLAMQVGAATEVVSVQGEAAQIDYDSHTIGGVITRQEIENLPLNGRSFLNLAMLEPGVTVSANSVGQYNRLFDVNILGADSGNGSVRITVDGATIADSVTGGTQQNFSQEVVQEFQLSSTNLDLSNAIGAGGASQHRDARRHQRFSRRASSSSTATTTSRPIPICSASPPSRPVLSSRGASRASTSADRSRRISCFSSPPWSTPTKWESIASSQAIPLFQQFASYAASPFHENEFDERLDWLISPKHSASLRYSHDGNNGYAPPGGGDLPSDWDVNTNWADSGVFTLTSALSPSLTNEFRYSYTYWSNTNNPPTAAQCPAPCLGLGRPNISIYGVSNFTIGNATNAPQSRVLRRNIFQDNISKTKGAHSMKFGAYWEYQQGTGTYAYAAPAAAELFSPEIVQVFQFPGAGAVSNLDPVLLYHYCRHPAASGGRIRDGRGRYQPAALIQSGNADHDNTFHFYWQDNWRVKPQVQPELRAGLDLRKQRAQLRSDQARVPGAALRRGRPGPRTAHAAQFQPHAGLCLDRGQRQQDRDPRRRRHLLRHHQPRRPPDRARHDRARGHRDGPCWAIASSSRRSAQTQRLLVNLPPPLQPTALASEPTTFTGAELVNLIPAFYAGAQAELGPPGNTSLAIRNINVFKTGEELLAHNFRAPYSEHASIGIQRELRTDFVVTADFVFRQYLHQIIRDTDLNHFYSAAGPVIPACTGGARL